MPRRGRPLTGQQAPSPNPQPQGPPRRRAVTRAPGDPMPNSFAAAYHAAMELTGGACPIEAGGLGYLPDHECRHGRLPASAGAPCGCWPEETDNVVELPTASRPKPETAEAA